MKKCKWRLLCRLVMCGERNETQQNYCIFWIGNFTLFSNLILLIMLLPETILKEYIYSIYTRFFPFWNGKFPFPFFVYLRQHDWKVIFYSVSLSLFLSFWFLFLPSSVLALTFLPSLSPSYLSLFYLYPHSLYLFVILFFFLFLISFLIGFLSFFPFLRSFSSFFPWI